MPPRRWCVRVTGVVQGVGFRPTVWRYATNLGLAGFVRNAGSEVVLEVEGEEQHLKRFLSLLRSAPPPRARITDIRREEKPPRGLIGFTIEDSTAHASLRQISPDVAICAACLAEIGEPTERRYRYPFTNCTNCGPRYTIITDLPYDRSRTSMATFALCDDCLKEYENPADRRFHAQPVACPRCGPSVSYVEGDHTSAGSAAVADAVRALKAGRIVAIKGLGGYHLACLAEDAAAVARLRTRKGREAKPFAVMVPDVGWADRLAEVNGIARALLLGPEKPIVLLRRSETHAAALPEGLAPGLNQLGLFLPYTPLHAILLHDVARPLVMTSGNLSDDPIACGRTEAARRLSALTDAFLHHDRPIVRRCEDSVCSVIAGGPSLVRRARGYAPAPIAVTRTSAAVILAVGGHLKNTFCFLKDRMALVGPHLGDLHHLAAYEQFCRDIQDLSRLLEIQPDLVAYDLHPDYLSTKYALGLPAVPKVPVQHHHAHIASCLAEHGAEGPVIGVAFDGLGMGHAGQLWGGEFLIADLAQFTRAAWVESLLLPGGQRALREGWRVAAACLWELGGPALLSREGAALFGNRQVQAIQPLLSKKINCIPITSAGRIFDCIAALSGLCLSSSYEGNAAMRLESCYAAATPGPDYRMPVRGTAPPYRIAWGPLVLEVLRDRQRGATPQAIATRFHRGFALAVRNTCLRLRDDYGLNGVALSGGVFHNKVFTELLAGLLRGDGFTVLLHRNVPPGDGGISLGQAVIADRTGGQS